MTSGNRGDEPICRTPEQAFAALHGIADAFLVHDREVVRRTDDSVVRSTVHGPLLVRRSRGYVPEPLPLPAAAPAPVLALGGHLQTTVTVALGGQAFPSQHVGDLDTEPARAFLLEVGAALEGFLEVAAKVIVVDEHPDYPSTWIGERLAQQRGGRVLRVQHHLAHAAAVLGEHGRFPAPGERAGALVLDGTGFGPDGLSWGCECLVLDGELAWWRAGTAAPLQLVGGERAVREPWRVAVAALQQAGAGELCEALPMAASIDAPRRRQLCDLAARGGWPLASGAGRIFEAAAAIAGLCAQNGWEGEAAVRLESLAAAAVGRAVGAWPEVVAAVPAAGGIAVLPSAALLAAFAQRLVDGENPATAALGFHVTFGKLAAGLVAALPADVKVVALGGGCLVNRLLQDALLREIGRQGRAALLPRLLPPGDGGLSYGQAVLAAAALARGRAIERRQPGG
jgi:hydrogenase maturation protein HypF